VSETRESPSAPDPPVAERTLGAYLDAIAGDAPTPGGGSVVAVVAAMAAALGEMVCNFSTKDGPTGAALHAALGELSTLRQRCLALAVADEAVYAGYRAASSLPRGDDAAHAARSEAMHGALVTATETPLRLAEACLATIDLLVGVAPESKKSLRSDVEIAVLLAEAALRGALATARGNLGGLDDESRGGFATRAAGIERSAARARDAALGVLGRR